jgi:N-methylhydantoinase B
MFTVLADRELEGPWGLFGGDPGRRAAYIQIRDGQERQLSSKTTVALKANDTISYRTCGGGGYGPAAERDPELVRADVLDGKVTAENARSAYGVALDPQRTVVDAEATVRLRASMATEAPG